MVETTEEFSSQPDKIRVRSLYEEVLKEFEDANLESPPVSEDKEMKSLLRVLSRKLPTEQLRQIKKGIFSKVSLVKEHIPDFVVGGVLGFGGKGIARLGIAASGGGGLAALAVVGAVAGAVPAVGREYLKQRQDIVIEPADNVLKNEWKRWIATDKVNLCKAGLRGALVGAVGAVVGIEIAEITDFLSQNELVQEQIASWHEKFFPGSSDAPALEPVDKLSVSQPLVDPVVVIPTQEEELMSPTELETTLTDVVYLPKGSNPTNEVSNLLKEFLGREPDPSEIVEATKEACRQSNIAVSQWEIDGDHLDTNLPALFPIKITPSVLAKAA